MTPTIRTSGNSRSHIVHAGYQDRQRNPAPIMPMRHDGDLSLWVGALIVLAGFVFIAGAVTMVKLLIVAVAA